jgi:hypothetical protein
MQQLEIKAKKMVFNRKTKGTVSEKKCAMGDTTAQV